MSLNPKNEKLKSEKFVREGAKYLCTKCRVKYFSRDEVEKCYDSHIDKTEEAKKVDADPKLVIEKKHP